MKRSVKIQFLRKIASYYIDFVFIGKHSMMVAGCKNQQNYNYKLSQTLDETDVQRLASETI